MLKIRATRAQLQQGIKLNTGEPVEVRVVAPLLIQVVGECFETNKSFLLPDAISVVRRLRRKIAAVPRRHLLIVGHADTAGGNEINDPLSLERADAVLAFLRDDSAAWLANYENSVPEARRWSQNEDALMARALGAAEGTTRSELIQRYMALDGEPFADSAPPGYEFSTHGCGEHFPLAEEGTELDTAPADDAADATDRRVEFFLFPLPGGVTPAPAGANSAAGSTEYPTWRKLARRLDDFVVGDNPEANVEVTFIEFPDILFNHSSAIPCLDEAEHLLHGLTQTYLFARENPDREVLVVGHTDTSGETDINYPLSEQRAQAVLAILQNDEATWSRLVEERSKVEDRQRILKTLSKLYYWDCDPGEVDDVDGPATQAAVEGFQREVNSIFSLGLAVDGDMGEQTWLAVFKVYRALLEEMGVNLDHAFVLGNGGTGIYACGESFPIEAKGNSNLKSQTNRRAEVYFAEPGKVQPLRPPISPQATLTIRDCVLFDPIACKRTVVGHKALLTVRHTDIAGEPLAGVQARLFGADGSEAAPPQTTNERGFVFWVDLDPGEFDVRFDDDDADDAEAAA